ncbi:MAG: FadR family transcriptional regulator [Chloroflexi bacterium]|nr:FadR family transcriptional regulator [Chloroflexota bacterium]
MPFAGTESGIMRYIVEHQLQPGDRLPTITQLSQELGVSVSKVREELEVVRTLGLVQVKPRTGTQVQEFEFGPTAAIAVLYALGLDRAHFHAFSELRKHLEFSFWHEAVQHLTPDDITDLRQLVACATTKLNHTPIEVPFQEHRSLHLTFFKHLKNPFVQGLLTAYWEAYQAFGLALYAELSYHREVWAYHARMVECVAQGDFDGGLQALREHMELLRHVPEQKPNPSIRHVFE